jgi:hypothetical protein
MTINGNLPLIFHHIVSDIKGYCFQLLFFFVYEISPSGWMTILAVQAENVPGKKSIEPAWTD